MKNNKINIRILLLLGLIATLAACTKELATPVSISIEVLNEEPLINEKVPILINGTGDFCTFYNGVSGKDYDSIPDARGRIVNFGDTIYQAYQRANTYKLTAIATSYGEWAEDQNMAITQYDLTVNDFNTEITRVFMTEPRYRLAKISNDTIIIKAGNIDLTEVSMQVITASQDATVYPNSDMTTGYKDGSEFTADFSNADPHVLVESFSKTTQKYPIKFE